MLIRNIMTMHPVRIGDDATLRRAAEIISIGEVSDVMVVNGEGAFLGVLSEGDVIRAAMPNFEEILNAGGSLAAAFDFFVSKGRDLADRPIAPLVITDAIIMRPTDEAAAAASIMVDRQIRRLPVVDDGKLVGTISRSDICRAIIYEA